MVVAPGVYFVCQDAAQRTELADNIGSGFNAAFSGLSGLISGNQAVTTLPTTVGTLPHGTALVDSGKKSKKPGVTASNVRLVDEAVKLLSAQIEQKPKDPSLHNRLGLIYAELGELSQAEIQFKEAIQLARVGLTDSRMAVEQKKSEGQLVEASQLMLGASQNELELSTAHSNLARVYEKLGQQSKVVAQLEELNRDVKIGGGLAQSLGLNTRAVSNVKLTRASVQVCEGMAKAESLMASRKLQQAMAQWKQVLAIDPTIAEAHEKLGRAALTTGDIALAIQELKKAAQLAPGKAATHAALGICYQCRSNNKEAIDEFKKALALDGKDALSAFNMGNAYAALNQNTSARTSYQLAIKLNPAMAVAHNNLATISSLSGQYDQAIQEFEQTLALAPRMASAHYGLGLAYFNKHEYNRASQQFKTALDLNPNLIDAHSKIETCYRMNAQSHHNIALGGAGGAGSGSAYASSGSGGYSASDRFTSRATESRMRPQAMAQVSGDTQRYRPRQRSVATSSEIDEGSNRNLVQRLN
jgi:tetratricopeptide (TPR) repeat protein